jgi:hypothetical protein
MPSDAYPVAPCGILEQTHTARGIRCAPSLIARGRDTRTHKAQARREGGPANPGEPGDLVCLATTSFPHLAHFRKSRLATGKLCLR